VCFTAAAGASSQRPFAGVPVLLKGLVQSHRDLPSIEGSRFLAHHRANATSELASRMEAAGAIVLGQTNVPELGLLATTVAERKLSTWL